MSWFKKSTEAPTVAPVAAPPQPTKEEQLAAKLTEAKADAKRRKISPLDYASKIGRIYGDFGQYDRGKRIMDVAASHDAVLRGGRLTVHCAFEYRYALREWFQKKTLAPLVFLEGQIAALAHERDGKLDALRWKLAPHAYEISGWQGPGLHVRGDGGEELTVLVERSLYDRDKSYFRLPSPTAGHVAPETLAVLRQEIIAQYDPKILPLCDERAELEQHLDTSTSETLRSALKKWDDKEARRTITREEYRLVQHLYRKMVYGERIERELGAGAATTA